MEGNNVRRELAPDILKLIAAFAVILIHVSGQGVLSYATDTFGWYSCTLWDSLARFAVPVFFMCTGALMLSPARTLTPGRIWKHYFLRVLGILMFWAWAYYVVTVVGQRVLYGWWEEHWLLNSVLETLRFNHHLHLYYLQMLLLFYAVLPVLRVFVRGASDRDLEYAVGLWGVLGILMPLLVRYPPFKWLGGVTGFYVINMAWSACGYALLGWLMSAREPQRRYLSVYLLTFAAGLLFTFCGTVAATKLSGSVNTDFMEGMSPGPCAMAVGLFGAVRCACAGRESTPRIAVLVKASFCVYLIHHFFIMAFRAVGFDVMLFAPILEIPAEAAVVALLSLGGWWVLSRIPFVRDHLI